MLPCVSRPVVAALGRAGVAFVGAAPRLGDGDEPADLTEITMQVSGGAAVAGGAAAALGCRVRLATRLAGDALGRFALEALDHSGIDTAGVVTDQGELTGVSFAALADDRRVAFRSAGDAGVLTRADLDLDGLLADADAVLLDGAHIRAAAALAEAARERDVSVVFDGSYLHEGVGELVALADVLICSERLASELAPRGELPDSLVELQRMGPRAVIITLGDGGSIGLHGEELVEQPAFPVEVVDTSEAGAVYHGTFVAGLVSQLPFTRCMEFASAAAALSCRHLGGWAGIPGRDEIVSLIRALRDQSEGTTRTSD
jgi:sulfofructose kinase